MNIKANDVCKFTKKKGKIVTLLNQVPHHKNIQGSGGIDPQS